MRLDVRIRKVAEKTRTTEYEILGEAPPMKDFYVNTEKLVVLPYDTAEMVLSISAEPFANGEVALAFPPVPFFREFKRVVRYERRVERRGKDRRAPNTPDTPVNLAYVNKADLENEFVADRKPIYFGLSPVADAVSGDRTQPLTEDVGAADEAVRAALLEALDQFLRDRFRPQRGARLTSQDVHDEFIHQEGANLSEDALNSLQLIDISRRVRAIFGVTMVKTGTRINGRHQRYWANYTI